MILGLLGTLVPIPLVPFFLLFFIGLGVYGVKKETIQEWKEKFKKIKFNFFKKKQKP